MFTIIISEKGGAERRESFEKNEINVGRVQGNDLMLPKGNVSKHHARLIYRDGRVIVTDLKSTNGTYVNGRKITQATVVREGDKIYIGDFIVRLDPGTDSNAPTGIPADVLRRGEGGQPLIQASLSHSLADPNDGGSAAEAPEDVHDPNPLIPRVPPAPRVPTLPKTRPSRPAPSELQPMSADRGSVPPAGSPMAATSPSQGVVAGARGAAAAVSASAGRALNGASLQREPSPAEMARKKAIATLVDRVGVALNLGESTMGHDLSMELSGRVEATAKDIARRMVDERLISDGPEIDGIVSAAVREITDIGPLRTYLDEEDVWEIRCLTYDEVHVVYNNGRHVRAAEAFSSDASLGRVVARLAQSAGLTSTADGVVEGNGPGGFRVTIVRPPLTTTYALVLRRSRQVRVVMDDFLKDGSLARPVCTFLEQCVLARSNLLIVGPSSYAVAAMLSALGASAPSHERLAVIDRDGQVVVPHALSFSASDDETCRQSVAQVAGGLVDRVIYSAGASPRTHDVVQLMASGLHGMMVGVCAPSIRQAVARLASQAALSVHGGPSGAIRDAVADAFDLVLFVSQSTDGRLKVARISETVGPDGKETGLRDVFDLVGGPTGTTAALTATGVVPRVASDLMVAGYRIDPNLFKRQATRIS